VTDYSKSPSLVHDETDGSVVDRACQHLCWAIVHLVPEVRRGRTDISVEQTVRSSIKRCKSERGFTHRTTPSNPAFYSSFSKQDFLTVHDNVQPVQQLGRR
jgi:hypothetical protein